MKQIFLILENIRSLYNVGAIFRIAEAAGLKKIYLVGPTGILIPTSPGDTRKAILNPKLAKTALGAEKHLAWQHFWTTAETIDDIKKQYHYHPNKLNICALEQTSDSKNYTKVKYKLPLALVLGNEKNGVRKQTLKLCQRVIQIPMLGNKKSLNVATAAGIAIFEILRQLKNKD